MTVKDLTKHVVGFSHQIVRGYVSDLTDEQLLVRSVPGTNHIAWSLGHLIAGDTQMLEMIGHTGIKLPSGFVEQYTKETATSDDPAKFHRKSVYLDLMDKSRTAVLAAIDRTPEADFDKPAPEEMRAYAPTVAAVLTLLGTHWLMHAGQFVPIRRVLGKPPLF
jgi:hypothetical protein